MRFAHGLTAETVITPLEDPEDYKAFEQAVTADYEAETAVERELVLRLASLLWRLRRATSIETGLLQIQEESFPKPSRFAPTVPFQDRGVTTISWPGQPTSGRSDDGANEDRDALAISDIGLDVARRFLRLADLDNGVFQRPRFEILLAALMSREAESSIVGGGITDPFDATSDPSGR